MTTGDSIEEIREEHARAEAHQDKLLLTITEELKLRLKWKRLNPSTRISWRDYWLKAQLAKDEKHYEPLISEIREKLTELEKKLDDREADLIEAKWEEGEKLLAIIRDWDVMTEEEGGEEKWQKKYGLPTTDLVQVLEQALNKGELNGNQAETRNIKETGHQEPD